MKNKCPKCRNKEVIYIGFYDLEGLKGVLDGYIFNHRGLRKDRLLSFISLWLYSRNL